MDTTPDQTPGHTPDQGPDTSTNADTSTSADGAAGHPMNHATMPAWYEIGCPHCGARELENCRNPDGDFRPPHMARLDARAAARE